MKSIMNDGLRNAFAGNVGMMFATDLVWSALNVVMSNAEAALDVTVDLAHTHPYAADQGYLANVATESRPESVIGTALVVGPGVNEEPVDHSVTPTSDSE